MWLLSLNISLPHVLTSGVYLFKPSTGQSTTLDRAFIPNICYAIAVGMWLTWRYRDEDSPGKRVQGRN